MSERQLVVFRLGSEEYATPVSDVAAIVAITEITPLPHLPAHVLGVTVHREQVVAVIDLGSRFGLRSVDPLQGRALMIERDKSGAQGSTAAVLVDSVVEVLTLDGSKLQPPPAEVSLDADFLEGVALIGDRMIVSVDVRRVLESSGLSAAQLHSFTGQLRADAETTAEAAKTAKAAEAQTTTASAPVRVS